MPSNKLPTTLGGVADQLHRVRAERLKLQNKVDEMRGREKELREYALGMLNRARVESARGKLATITRVEREVPNVTDWDAVYSWVHRHKALEIFERRIHRQAWRDRVEADGEIPGIKAETILDLHITSKRGLSDE